MNEINRITIICAGYPTPVDPTMLPFIDQLVCSWADLGLDVNVICPIMRFVEFKSKNRFYKKEWIRRTEQGKEFSVYHPRYFGFGALESKISFLYRIGYWSFQKAIRRKINALNQLPDVLYSHFLSSGMHAGDLSQKYDLPGFCAFGESSLWSVNSDNIEMAKRSINKLKGIISVSTENKEKLVQSGLYPAEKICVIPNAVNTNVFYPRGKNLMRKKYGFQYDEVIGIFVGEFCERKGVLRVQEAACNARIKMIYIGGGEEDPVGENILFKGKVPHETIAEFLSAADFFVLPTRAEGCCNAIIEAIACGLPVISSDKHFNDDILTDDYSIRVDPNDVDQIQAAMISLATDKDKRINMSVAARNSADSLSIDKRAKRILEYMKI